MTDDKFLKLIETVGPAKINDMLNDAISNAETDDLPKKIEYLKSKYQTIEKILPSITDKKNSLLGKYHLELIRAVYICFKACVYDYRNEQGLSAVESWHNKQAMSGIDDIGKCITMINRFDQFIETFGSVKNSLSAQNKRNKKKQWVKEVVEHLKSKYPGLSAEKSWAKIGKDGDEDLESYQEFITPCGYEVYVDMRKNKKGQFKKALFGVHDITGDKDSIFFDAFNKYFYKK